MRVVEAQYDNGVLRPIQHLGLRTGERVNLIVVRRPDPSRWDLDRLAKTAQDEDGDLAEQGLSGWSAELDAAERPGRGMVGEPRRLSALGADGPTPGCDLAKPNANARPSVGAGSSADDEP